MDPTVFVVPPHPALLCPIHHGALNTPVTAPCGCTFCKRCILDMLKESSECPNDASHIGALTPAMLQDNNDLAERVSELLIHCRYGIHEDPEEGWVPNSAPDSCKMWINLGNREVHEASCPHKPDEDDFCLIEEDELLDFQVDSDEALDSDESFELAFEPALPPPLPPQTSLLPPPSVPPPQVCSNKDLGCKFVCSFEEDMRAHVIACDKEYMQTQIVELTMKLMAREEELAYLRTQMAEEAQAHVSAIALMQAKYQDSTARAHSNVNNNVGNQNDVAIPPPDIYAALSKGLDKLEEESHRIFEEAAETFKKTKAAIKRQSAVIFSNIKQTFEEVGEELVSKFQNIVKSLEKPAPALAPAPRPVPEVTPQEDDELTQAIRASEEAFKVENDQRSYEDEQIKQALRISLELE